MFRTLSLCLALAVSSTLSISAGDLTIVSVPGALETLVYGLNNHGDLAGTYKDAAGKQHGFVVSKGVYVYPIDAPVAGTAYTQVWGINEAGVIVGSYAAPSVSHGFVLRNGKFTSFDVPDSTFTAGFAVNTEGDVTGHYGTPPSGKMRGYLLRNGVFTTFGAGDWGLPNTMTCGFGINAEQSIVGHFADGTGQHGFLLAGSVFTPINYPETGAHNTNADGVNPQGEIVGYYQDSTGKWRGFFRSAWGDFTTLDVPSALATFPRKINARGQIAGYFRDNGNVLRSFVLSR
ncbi:MAG TPA: hypothetical protein VGK29_19105 [Paludibaculum sp.]